MSPIYFDMDGVLADFDEAYDRRIGERKPNGDVYWDRVNELGDFFKNLKPFQQMLDLWFEVPSERRYILSSIPKNIDISGDQKREWLSLYCKTEIKSHVILVRGKSLKKQYAKPGHILIDDWKDNIKDWVKAGGIGIHHTEPTITRTMLHPYIL